MSSSNGHGDPHRRRGGAVEADDLPVARHLDGASPAARAAVASSTEPARRAGPPPPGGRRVGLPRTVPRLAGWHSASALTVTPGELVDGGAVSLGFPGEEPGDGHGGAGGAPGAIGTGRPGGDDVEGEAFRDTVGRGLRWSFGTQLLMRMASFASGIVIFRLLEPAQFGVYALALAVINVLLSLNDLGQDMAVVAWQGPGLERARRTASSIALGMSVLLYGAVFAAAPLIAELAESAAATGIIRVMALTLLIDGFLTVPRALMYKALDQRHISLGELLTVPVSLTVSLGLVILGAGPWGPALGTLAGAVAHGVATVRFAPAVPVPGWDWGHAKRLLRFGLPGAGTMTIELALINVDSIIVAYLLGPTALGFYALAFNVSSWPSTIITNAVRKVSQPAFTRLAAAGDWQAPFNRSLTILMSVLIPVCLLLAVQAEPLVRLVYGEKSLPAAPVLSWLVLLGGTRVFMGYLLDLMIALQRPASTLRAEAVWLAAVAPALWIGAELGGIRGVAIGHVIVALGVACPLFLHQAHRAGVRLGGFARQLVRPALGAAVGGAAGLFVAQLDTPLVALVASGIVVMALYVPIAVTRQQADLVLGVVRRRPAT